MENHGLVTKQRLTEAEIAEIKHLTTLCNNYENLHTRPNFDMIRNRSGEQTMLEETIRTIRSVSQKRITLEVDTTNTIAMNLYLSVGFDVETTYNYYALNL
jgi:ribosomal protein S18 acetylase RimI-like enzyme